MIRALLISIALHLMILLSPIIPEGSMGQSSFINAHLFAVVLRQRSDIAIALAAQDSGIRQQGVPYFQREGDKGVWSKQPRSEKRAHAALPIAATPRAMSPDDRFVSSAIPVDAHATQAEGVQEYRLNVSREARKFKRYPLIAREQGWEGVVVIAVSMTLPSAQPVVSLERSSGYDELDRQALEMMVAAVRQATLPEGMRGRRFGISLPIEYRLAEKQ